MFSMIRIAAATAILSAFVSNNSLDAAELAPGLKYTDKYTVAGPRSFLADYVAVNQDGSVNVVVEIPTGTVAKWEVMKPDGKLKWEFKKGKPRVVKFLGYPGNYGMIPRTLLAKDKGGDGDPLDVLILGEALPRGAVVIARPIGVLKLMDDGEVDDKIIAVLPASPLAKAQSIDDMNAKFPGVLPIVETWFTSYKGPGEISAKGYMGPKAAMDVIKSAARTYDN